MRRRIFIAIDLPNDLKRRIRQKTKQWQHLPVIWTKEDNLHLTLQFLGYVDDEQIPEYCEAVKRAAQKNEAFDITFEKIKLGPEETGNRARMFWLAGEVSEELKKLILDIEEELGFGRKEKKAFRAHVTIGRIKQKQWNKLKETPVVSEKLSASISADVLQVLESVVVNGKREYLPIESCELK